MCATATAAAEHHDEIRAAARAAGRAAGAFDLMIAAHARALHMSLATSDKAIGNLAITGLRRRLVGAEVIEASNTSG